MLLIIDQENVRTCNWIQMHDSFTKMEHDGNEFFWFQFVNRYFSARRGRSDTKHRHSVMT